MANSYFQFKEFTVYHDRCAMKVTTDACLFGAWCAQEVQGSGHPAGEILDIGSGSGLLSLMVAQKSAMIIEGIEIDKAAAEQASENVARSPWSGRIQIVHTDVRNWKPAKRYQYIVSNPPFYEKDLKSAKTSKNIAHHDEGLQLTVLFDFIKENLAETGSFFLLLPAKRAAELDQLLKQYNFELIKKVIVRQTPQHPPFRILVQAGKSPQKLSPLPEIVIKDGHHHYTPEFISLLKDYYLYL